MSISEHRIPQDGRIQTAVGGKLIDLRVSCLPTNHGESIVMRILDKEGLRLGLPELGFFTDDQQTFEHLIGLPCPRWRLRSSLIDTLKPLIASLAALAVGYCSTVPMIALRRTIVPKGLTSLHRNSQRYGPALRFESLKQPP